MRMVVAGGRDYTLNLCDYENLATTVEEMGVTEIVTGGAKGVDTDAHEWACMNQIKTQMFFADWDYLGKAAGPIRNRRMAEYADIVCLFPGGAGTASMEREAMKHNCHLVKFPKSR